MSGSASNFLGGITELSDVFLPYFVALAALGVLTAGLIEAYKKVANVQQRFHQKAIWRWLSQEENRQPGNFQIESTFAIGGHYGVGQSGKIKTSRTDGRDNSYDALKAYAELLHLTTGLKVGTMPSQTLPFDYSFTRNIGFALFELELARMMSQVQDAADAALNNPGRYENWFVFLTRGCADSDVAAWRAAIETPPPNGIAPVGKEELAAIYARIRLLMRRQLDSFQTITSYRWREWNQLWSWIIGGIAFYSAQALYALPVGGTFQQFVDLGPLHFKMIIVAATGGLLAPIAKDLADALTKAKADQSG
jgi:hypothetical protein